ncbi:MAG: class I SAM-dependent methyltransferase [Actinomycetota bacterium]|nr:class I SAM-dependent methyltransferase [Actinomycetota bacterium]
MLDGRVRSVLERLEMEDADEQARGVARELRARQVAPTTGKFLFAQAASHPGCRVLEIGGSRGYSTVWIAAGARLAGGSVVSLELDPLKIEAWRDNLRDAGLGGVAELVEGDAHETLPGLEGEFDLCFLDAEKDDYEGLFALARGKLHRGSLVVADNVTSHEDTLGAYSSARQADDTLESLTVTLDRGLEVSVVLR